MKFTIEEETDNKICFLDVSITRNGNSLSFNVYSKPTTTDTIIPNDSCHPPEHKTAAIRFLTNRRDTYSLNNDNRESENNIIHQILYNNSYDTTLLHKPPKTITHHNDTTHDKKWVRLTYVGKETRFITKLFKNSSALISYTKRNMINKLLSTHNHIQQDKYEKSGIYKLTCPECKKAYVGQTGRPFSVRFREHFRDYRHANNKSKFAEHLLNHQHSFGPMNTIMDILHVTSKGTMMNTIERFHIYNETKNDNQIDDRGTVKPNTIFDSIIQVNSDRGLPTPQ
jgi:hypothetical protein